MVEGMYRNQNSDRINNSPHCAADDNNKAIDTLQYHNKMALLDGVGGGGGVCKKLGYHGKMNQFSMR